MPHERWRQQYEQNPMSDDFFSHFLGRMSPSEIDHFMKDATRGYGGNFTYDMFQDMMRRMHGYDEEDEELVTSRIQLAKFEQMLKIFGPERLLRFVVDTLAEMGDLEEILRITQVMAEDHLRRENSVRRYRGDMSPTGRMPSFAVIDESHLMGDDIYHKGVKYSSLSDMDYSALEERAQAHSKIKNPQDFRRSSHAPQTPRSPRKGRG